MYDFEVFFKSRNSRKGLLFKNTEVNDEKLKELKVIALGKYELDRLRQEGTVFIFKTKGTEFLNV